MPCWHAMGTVPGVPVERLETVSGVERAELKRPGMDNEATGEKAEVRR